MKAELRMMPKGPLYVEVRDRTTFAIRPVPPRCWSTFGDSPLWEGAHQPGFCLGAAARELVEEDKGRPVAQGEEHATRRAARRRLFGCVDDVVRREVALWRDGTWPLFRLLATSPEARELCATEDGRRLAWICAQGSMLLSTDRKRARALATVRGLLGRRRRAIVGELGFPATEATVRAIGRIVPANMSRPALRNLVWVLADPDRRRRAARLPRLSAVVLGALSSHYVGHCSDRLLAELAEDTLPDEGG